MDAFRVTHMGNNPGVLICCIRISTFEWHKGQTLPMLSLISSDQISKWLDDIEIKLAVIGGGHLIEMPVDECLSTSLEHRIDIRFIPSRLFPGLEFRVQIVQPLSDIALIRL